MLNLNDTVKIINNNNNNCNCMLKQKMGLSVGDIGTIVEIHHEDDGTPYYFVETNRSTNWWWTEDNLQKGKLEWVAYED